MHRVAVIGAGTLDSLPHNGAVVSLLAVCGQTHRDSYLDIGVVSIVSAMIALVTVIVLGSLLGSFLGRIVLARLELSRRYPGVRLSGGHEQPSI